MAGTKNAAGDLHVKHRAGSKWRSGPDRSELLRITMFETGDDYGI